MRRIKVFLFNGLLLTVTGLFMQSIGMFFGVYISNKIGTEGVGVYWLVMSVYSFFITFGCSGINLATVRIISEQETFSMFTGIKKAMKKCLFYSFFMGCMSCFTLFVFAKIISTSFLHDKVSSSPLHILALSLPFLSLSSCINGYFTALRRVKKSVFSQILGQFFKIGFICMLLNICMPSSIEGTCIILVLGSTLSEIISFLLLFLLFLLDKRKLKGNSYADTNYTKQILSISIPISFTSYVRSGLSTLKNVLIPSSLEKSGLSCKNALSEYGVINGMVMPVIMFPCSFISSFSSLLIPEFSAMNAKRDNSKINFSLNKIFKFCFIFSFLIMGIFWCFSSQLNAFIYPNTELAFYIKILCPLVVLMYIDNIVDSILKGLDMQVWVMGINILDLASSILLIYFLLPKMGSSGYIVVLFVSEILNGILSLLLLMWVSKFKIDFTNWIVKPLFSVIFLSFVFNSLIEIQITSVFELIFGIFCFCIFYFIIIVLLKGIVKKDVTFFLKK